MWNFLDNLRRKPVRVRNQIAIGTTSVLSLFIALVWWNSWTLNPSAQSSKTSDLSPVAALLGMFGDLKNKTNESWDQTMGEIQYVADQGTELAGVGAYGGGEFKKSDIVYSEDIHSGTSSTLGSPNGGMSQ